MSGRRRQGKTYLLQALIEAAGGLYFGATEATEAESLRLFADAVASYGQLAAPPRLASWDDAIRFLFSSGWGEPRMIIIDEFDYLSGSTPALPSILQREIDQGVAGHTDIKVLLCGSAISIMGGLLGGRAPLRGRSSLEVVVRPFPYRDSARFWGISDPELAILHGAVVGGTPAYRGFVRDDTPDELADFDQWVIRTALDPGTPLFREARYLLEEESGIRDAALYQSTLAAVANGNHTRGGIANYIGRKAADIGHHLNVLEDCGLLRRDADVFRPGRSCYRMTEPLIAFYQVIMRPQWGPLESGRARVVWADARPRFLAQVAGPHFEQLCREFALAAPTSMFGGVPAEVGAGVLSDPARRGAIEVDVVVLSATIPGEPRRVLSLGKAEFADVMGARHVQRLRRAQEILTDRGYDTKDTVLACYSGAGFDPGLYPAAGDRLKLIGPQDLYADETAAE